MMEEIQEAIRHLGWVRSSNNEKVIRALLRVGIKPENCFMDQEDNLIIPCKEIQRKKQTPFFCKIGWHKVKEATEFDGASLHGICMRCGKELMQDSQGNWF